MNIVISMLEGQRLKASFGDHEVICDQNDANNDESQYPEPFDYFLASMPLCASFYIRKFCQSRDISTDGIKISQDSINIDEHNKYKKKLVISVELPETFPKKYQKALLAAANTCTVKRVIQAAPEFEINLI